MICALLAAVVLSGNGENPPDMRRAEVLQTVARGLAAQPWRPPRARAARVLPGHGADIAGYDVAPEASYFDHGSGVIYAGNKWDNTTQAWVPRPSMRRDIRAHEFGHALDVMNMTDADRGRARSIMHLKTNKPWWGNPDDQNHMAPTPAERFADWYASIATDENLPGSDVYRSSEYDTVLRGGRRAVREFVQLQDEIRRREALGDYKAARPLRPGATRRIRRH